MTQLTAKVTTVQLVSVSVEGLRFSDGTYGISVQQANDLLAFSSTQNHASQALKRILGKEFSPPKIKVEGENALQNCIALVEFEKILLKLAIAGNIPAQELSENLIGLSLVQLFSDAFGIKFEKEQRQLWMDERKSTKVTFHPLTDAIQKYLGATSQEFGLYIWQFQTALKVATGTRDFLSVDELRTLNNAQVKVATMLECGKTWRQCLDAIRTY